MVNKLKKIALGGGCFWCTEAVFKMLRGISRVTSGYAGGTIVDPTYEMVSAGRTGHAEVIYLEYDPDHIAFREILAVFFASHDPTSIDRQGSDIGSQYRSIILYETEDQKIESEKIIQELNNSAPDGKPIVTEVRPLKSFYEAELYHQNYFNSNPEAPYCQVVINPKLEKIQQEFANLLKEK